MDNAIDDSSNSEYPPNNGACCRDKVVERFLPFCDNYLDGRHVIRKLGCWDLI